MTGDPSLDIVGRIAADWVTQGISKIPELEVSPAARGPPGERKREARPGRGRYPGPVPGDRRGDGRHGRILPQRGDPGIPIPGQRRRPFKDPPVDGRGSGDARVPHGSHRPPSPAGHGRDGRSFISRQGEDPVRRHPAALRGLSGIPPGRRTTSAWTMRRPTGISPGRPSWIPIFLVPRSGGRSASATGASTPRPMRSSAASIARRTDSPPISAMSSIGTRPTSRGARRTPSDTPAKR